MSRRAAKPQESLELLLDTLCNTFGGVMFIALLIVLESAFARLQPGVCICGASIYATPAKRFVSAVDQLNRPLMRAGLIGPFSLHAQIRAVCGRRSR